VRLLRAAGSAAAGDIWVDGSRQYQDFESYLIPEPTFALLKAEGPLPVAIDTDVESYLAGRRAALDREIEEVARLADQGKLDGVDLTGGELVISPVQASTPPEAEKLKEAAYAVLPTSKDHGCPARRRQLDRIYRLLHASAPRPAAGR